MREDNAGGFVLEGDDGAGGRRIWKEEGAEGAEQQRQVREAMKLGGLGARGPRQPSGRADVARALEELRRSEEQRS